MKIFFNCFLIGLFVIFSAGKSALAQNSLLVNFGTSSCTGSGDPAFSLIKDPLTLTPSQLITCSLVNQLPDIFGVFIAYNPKNNRIYVADVRDGLETKIWVLDVGLPENITCPLLNTAPDYTYSYVSNNFEFDNNGNLWSFSNYNDTTGECDIDNFDVNTGVILSTRSVQFPAGRFPGTIASGDLTILPNGRMFATLGANPSTLYEITNYNTATNAKASFLDTLPHPCYGIAYLNGQLEITGSDFTGNCYYYQYNIASKELDSLQGFQNGQLPIDNTSITPSLGVAKQLVTATKINSNTADITYEIYLRNLGNVSLNNINLSDNIAAVFGASNISNIAIAFVPGNNTANLLLNSSYNGNTNTNLFIPEQNLANQIAASTDYFVKLQVSFTATNINPSKIYLNSAIGSATIGSAGTSSFINVSDSSNNGTQNAVDPNNNGNAGEAGENIPTPFSFGALPVKFINISAYLNDKTSAEIKWVVATPTLSSDKFEVEYSADGTAWKTIGTIKILNINLGNYQLLLSNIPYGDLYYRVKETDLDGNFIYSNIVVLQNKNTSENFIVFPNPANNNITITSPYNSVDKTQIILYDAAGKLLTSKILLDNNEKINTAGLPGGNYVLKIINNNTVTTQKIVIIHK